MVKLGGVVFIKNDCNQTISSFFSFTLHEYPVSLKFIQFSSLIAGINKETANKLIGLA